MRKIAVRCLRAAARYLESPHLLALRRRGVDVSLFEKLHSSWLQEYQIATVLDIGANYGQFALAISNAIPSARIFSFEPLPECYSNLLLTMNGRPNFTAFQVALGEVTGELEFQRNAFLASSSFLEMADVHKTAFPATSSVQTVKVPVERLDDVAARLEITEPLLVKIDVQGYEDRVLRGGEDTFKRAKVVIAETSFETLYKGQPLFAEIHSSLGKLGFSYAGSFDQLLHPTTGKPLQSDSVFVRK